MTAGIWLGEQECFSWGVTFWTSVAAALCAGWVARRLTRNSAVRSA